MSTFNGPHAAVCKQEPDLSSELDHEYCAHDFLIPYSHRHRFFVAVQHNGHKVASIWPWGPRDPDQWLREMYDQDCDADSLSDVDNSDAEVGFPVGSINGVTVLEVWNAAGQDWVDKLDPYVQDTPRIWSPNARHYLFKYVEPSALALADQLPSGLRLLNDGDWISYPGNLIDGQLVHWEIDMCFDNPLPLPPELRSV